MKHSPVTAHIVITYPKGGGTSAVWIEDVLDRRRYLFSCPHNQVVAAIAGWTEDNEYDQCEIVCEPIAPGHTASAAAQQSDKRETQKPES